jgi:hypothetical protein
LKDEIDKLIPVMSDLSPENSKSNKKRKHKVNSEIAKEVYNKDKLRQTQEMIDKIKQEQIDHRSKIKRDMDMEKLKQDMKKEQMMKVKDKSLVKF